MVEIYNTINMVGPKGEEALVRACEVELCEAKGFK